MSLCQVVISTVLPHDEPAVKKKIRLGQEILADPAGADPL